jgi:lipoic acid synthetase
VRYVPPEEFEELRQQGEKMGFKAVFSAPLVRSSFHAAEVFKKIV